MSNVLYETVKYDVISTDNALGEDGDLGHLGYAVVNKETTQVECTTQILPQAIYQAQGFSDSLVALMDESAKAPADRQMTLLDFPTPEDVVPS
jgi:hypothetical protein